MWTDNLRYQGALGKAQLGLGSGGQGTYRAFDTFILDWFTPEVRKLFLPCALYPYLCWTWGGRDKLISLQASGRGGKQIYNHCAKRLGLCQELREGL